MPIRLDWDAVEACVKHICDVIEELEDIKVSTVVGINKGGVIPAMLLAKRLDVDFNVMHIDPAWTCFFDDKFSYQLRDGVGEWRNVLLVDDICDSGRTMKSIIEQLQKEGYHTNTLNTCALIYKSKSIHTPNLYAIKTEEDSWYQFPWESDNEMQKDMR